VFADPRSGGWKGGRIIARDHIRRFRKRERDSFLTQEEGDGGYAGNRERDQTNQGKMRATASVEVRQLKGGESRAIIREHGKPSKAEGGRVPS